MKYKSLSRAISMLLAITMLFSLLAFSADAASLSNSRTVTVTANGRGEYLSKSTGGTIGGGYWSYTSNDGLTGSAYCVDWGLSGVSPTKALTIQDYSRDPHTMGAFANGYPQRSLEQFKELHPDVRGIGNLTEDEYKYATQVAVWVTCGQLSFPGTSYTAGRAAVVQPTSDAQQIRIFDSILAILQSTAGWTHAPNAGMSLRAEENKDIRGIEVMNENGLKGAAAEGKDGIKKETINGQEYYTRTMYV